METCAAEIKEQAQKISSNDVWSLIGSLCMKIALILTFQEVDENRKINCVNILKRALWWQQRAGGVDRAFLFTST